MRGLALGLILSLLSATALGHGGGTDSMGCHQDTATGTRHCHTASSNSTESEDTSPLLITGSILLGLGAFALYLLAKSVSPSHAALEPVSPTLTPSVIVEDGGVTLGLGGTF